LSEAKAQCGGDGPLSVSATDAHRYPEFLGTLAHELRNALAPIRISMHVVKLSTVTDPNVDESFAVIERQMRSFIALIDDLQDISRLARGAVVLQKMKIALADVLEGALEACRAQLESAEQTVSFEPPAAALFVDADPDRLQLVFKKLLQNAAKYSLPGGRVTVRCQPEGKLAAVHVIDTGIGIEPGMLERVFELFEQINDPKAYSRGGLGIGLTLARDIVRLHGGSIEARSGGTGHGSEFIVRLPLVSKQK
jgi:signal transduction histidine kinase